MAVFQQGALVDTQAPSSTHLLECSCTAGRGIEPHGRRLGNRERPANWESPCGRVPPLQRRHDQSVEHADCGHAAVVIGLQAVLMQSYDDPTSSSAMSLTDLAVRFGHRELLLLVFVVAP